MYKWILPTISEVLALSEPITTSCFNEELEGTAKVQNCGRDITSLRFINQDACVRAEREWCGAITALEQMLFKTINSDMPSSTTDDCPRPTQGLVLTGPVPILSPKTLLSSLQTLIFTAKSLELKAGTPFQLPPATEIPITTSSTLVLPLLAGDPLAAEQFCLILTAEFSLVMVLAEDKSGVPTFLFSFEPNVAEQAWRSLRERIVLIDSHFPVSELDALVEKYYPVAPDYRTVTQFSRLLLKNLPETEKDPEVGHQRRVHPQLETTGVGWRDGESSHNLSLRPDVELLQAFAHEVRTPLTTIRTLTRLLLKRRDLATEARSRLELIDHECTEQIDRMELLFRAAELESAPKHTSTHLTAMSLDQVLQQSIPRWQKQANRRNLTLDVVLPQQMPTVVSDPTMLDRVLTGLIENFTRSLPAGSHIQVQVIPAGDQLKLQLLPQSQRGESGKTTGCCSVSPIRKSLGQMLIFQPETGIISLNITATKHLFQAIGGKLIVRQRPHQGEVLTIFLPMHVKPFRQGSGSPLGMKGKGKPPE